MILRALRWLLILLGGATEAHDFYASVFRDSPDMLIIVSGKYEIVAVNDAACEILGYKSWEMTRRPLGLIIPERFHHKHRELFDAYYASPERRPMAESRAFLAQRKDGSELSVSISLSPVKTSAGAYIIAALRAVSAPGKGA